MYRLCIPALIVLQIIIALTRRTNGLPTFDSFSSQFSLPTTVSAAGGGGGDGTDADEDDSPSLVVSRGNDVLTSTQTQAGHYRDITLSLTAFNESFVFDLRINAYLFASNYIEKAITDSGEVYNDVDHVTGHCYYTGVLRNRTHSTAAFSTCHGITGYFAIGNVSYHVEAKGDDINGQHTIIRDHDENSTIFRCGTDSLPRPESLGRFIRRAKRSFLYPQDADGIDKVVEVYVANDNSQYRARSSDVDNVYRRTKDIMNVASLAYQPLRIYLVLVGIEVWTVSDQIAISSSNVDGTLSNWYTYRRNSINPFHYNDNGILLTNVAFGAVLGIAPVGYMCTYRYSASLISDRYSSAAVAGTTVAHEMGHNFGLQHDDLIAQCSCQDPFADNHCIMYSSSNPFRLSSNWSSCSRTQLDTSFSRGLDICLYNIPETAFQASSLCGNGIVEDGEQCDCGKAPSSECNSACCNSNTCQLTASATCAYGRCCDIPICQVKSSGTECRSKSNDCDLPESCNGVDARCPTDSYKPDGTDCTNIEAAYCYKGQCQSHRSQCELIWGPGTTVSNDLCYSYYNDVGEYYGNCGTRWASTGFVHIACDAKDVKCGLLQCEDFSKTLSYYRIGIYVSPGRVSIMGNTCHSFVFDYGTGVQDPGLVPNGAKCGDRQMCVNQKCVNISASSVSDTTSTISSTTTASTTTTTLTTTTTSTSTSTTSTTASTSTTPQATTTSTTPSTTSTTTSTASTTPSTTPTTPSTTPTTPSTTSTTPSTTSTTPSITSTTPSTTSTTTTTITSTTTSPAISSTSTTMSTSGTTNSNTGIASEGTFGVNLGQSLTGVAGPLQLDAALANRLSRYNFSTHSFRSSLISVSQYFYTEICAGIFASTTSQLKTTGAYPPLSFDWMSTAQNGVDSGCRGGVLSVNSIITLSISQTGGGVYSSQSQKETSWSMFSVTDTMKYDSQLLCVFGSKASSVYGPLPFSSPLVNPTSPIRLYNAATTAYTCASDASAYFFSMSVGVPAGRTATVQLVVSGVDYKFEMTRQNTGTTGNTTLARTVLIPCTSDARMILVDGEVVSGTKLISFTAFPYELKTGTSVSWAGYRTRDITSPGTITYDLWLVRDNINFQVENSVIRTPISGYYYVYASAGVGQGKSLNLSVLLNGNRPLFGLTRTATDHNGIDTIGHGMVVLLSTNDLLRVDAGTTAVSSSSGLHTSFLGMLLYGS